MTLYEINAALLTAIQTAIDPDTGEITNPDALEELQLARNEKLEGYALVIKNTQAEADAMRQEEKSLAERRRQKESLIERLKSVLTEELQGETLETARVKLGWRKSQSLEIADWRQLPEDCLRFPEPEPDKPFIRELLKTGAKLPGAQLVEKKNLQIK